MTYLQKTGVLLVNLGSPQSPTTRDVAIYLKQFLLDPKVIDFPWLWRQFLVRCLIIPRRKQSSSLLYKQIWTEQGSPLILHSKLLQEKLQQKLGDQYIVSLAMRYQFPSIEEGLNELRLHNLERLVILPLFPQYAPATTGSIIEEVTKKLKKWATVPKLHFIQQFYDDPVFIQAIAHNGAAFPLHTYDHVLFSFHGLPERHIQKMHRENRSLCYRRACFHTAKLLMDALHLDPMHCTVCFQSRLGKEPWCQPYSNDVIQHLAINGAKKIIVFSPAFVADCLETLYEIGIEYANEFRSFGGETVDLVPSLNSDALWVEALQGLVKSCKV